MNVKDPSDLYEYLSIKISEDEEVLTLASYAQPGQPVPNLLLGAVHYLLLKGKEHSLKNYYQSLVENADINFENAFYQFKDFAMYIEKKLSLYYNRNLFKRMK